MSEMRDNLMEIMRNVERFVGGASGLRLRSYQRNVAERILDSVLHGKGQTIVVIFYKGAPFVILELLYLFLLSILIPFSHEYTRAFHKEFASDLGTLRLRKIQLFCRNRARQLYPTTKCEFLEAWDRK